MLVPEASADPAKRSDEVDRWVDSANAAVRVAEETPGFGSDRCTIGGFVSSHNIVESLIEVRNATLQLGDRIVGVNGQAVQDRSELTDRLRLIAPASTIQVEIERFGQRSVVQLACINAAPFESAMLRLWRAIATRDWNECMDATIASQSLMGLTPGNTESYLYCGTVSGRLTSAQSDLARYEAVRTLVEWSRWDPQEWREARSSVLMNMYLLEQAGQTAFASRLGSLITEADQMQPPGTGITAANGPESARQPVARGDSLAFPAFVERRWVGEVVLGGTTLHEAIQLFPPTHGEGAPRRVREYPTARVGKVQAKPVRVFNPYATMYALFFDRNDRLVILQELGDVLEQQPVAEVLSRYPTLRETQRRRDGRELQGEIAPCVVLMLMVDSKDRVQAVAYVYSCTTQK